ncbi:SfnB family sulfur acquisition oxidoreductase, partial [Ralstonia pickettii]|nr:SfnB family sulfur acquisition oxidoreductase [Ralstonia pickettii]
MSETSATIQERPADTQPQAASVIADDAQAIAAAHALAQRLAQGAAERDRERRLPRDEIEWFSQSGLWAITVSKVVKIVAAADPSLGQLPQNHFGLVDVIALTGTDAQKRLFFSEVLSGKRFGNGFSEKGTKHVLDLKTRVRRDGDDYVVDGT